MNFFTALILAAALMLAGAVSLAPQHAHGNTTTETSTSRPAPPVFRFHLFKEPESLNPLAQKNSTSGYLFSQIQTPLLRWQDGKFHPGLAKNCKITRLKKKMQAECDLPADLRFSDGSQLTSDQWLMHFRAILDAQNRVAWASDLFDIEGAEELYQSSSVLSALPLGQHDDKPPEKPLGITVNKNKLTFTLKRNNQEFLYRLTSPLWVPFLPLSKDRPWPLGLGPYKLTQWQKGSKLVLEPNLLSREGHKSRPGLEVYFVTEDSVALKLYQSGELQFLRRLPTAFIPTHQKRPDYHEIDQIRFDYFGFTQKFRERPENKVLMKILGLAIPFEEMRALYFAKPRPGCFGLPANLSNGPVCFNEDLTQAKTLYGATERQGIHVLFSQSVEDHRRGLEWLQMKMKERLGLPLRLDGSETKVFLARLEKREAQMFRRGVAPDRPTCAAVLEFFLPGASENYLDLNDAVINKAVPLLLASSSEKEKAKLCRQTLEHLRNESLMIPTGPIFFAILADSKWTGWHLNELNQLDLKDLHLK